MTAYLDERYREGEEIDVANSLAVRLITRGYAVPVREVEIERAVSEAPERAAPKKRRRRRKAE